jgi:NADPH2:quinone reductase
MVIKAVSDHKLKINIHKVYPLTDVASAHEDLQGRKTTGKLLLKTDAK